MIDITLHKWFGDEDYQMYYQVMEGNVYIHTHLDNVNKAVIRDVAEKWESFKDRVKSLGYESVYTYTKDPRIVRIVEEGELVGEIDEVKVIKWDLN